MPPPKAKRRYTKADRNAPFYVMLRDAERQILRDALVFCDGVAADAAAFLGITPMTVSSRGRALGGVFPDEPRREPMKDDDEDEKHEDGDSSAEDSALDSDQPTDGGNGIADRDDAEQDESSGRDQQP